MKELSDLTAFSAGEKGLELTLFTEEGIPDNLIGDPLRLGQVLLNLVSNAIKFTEAGEIVVSARPVPRSDDRVEVIFTVSDTGIGISRETIPRLFESFSQADGSTTRKFGGTGLGLAICKHLVELMGGTITVQSTPSQGTTFSFTALFGVQDRTLEPPRPSPDLLGTRTLVVEDNRTTRKVLVHMLESFGFQVTEAASGQAALLAVELAVQDNAPFQLVILDWKMPGLDGIQTSQAIRRYLDKDNAPHMLMVSAHAHEELDELAERAGIGLALAKPVHRSALFNAIMESFGHRKNTAPRFRQETIPDLAHVQGARILVVEDNEINRQVIRELLEQAGMLVEEAPDGEKALNILDRRDHDVDLVLLDIEMPGMNGYETCTRLRKRAFLSDLPVLAMTAHAMQEDRDKSMAAGMNDHLTKPIDPDAVYKAIARWVPAGKASEEAPPDRTAGTPDIDQVLSERIPGLDVQVGLRRIGGNPITYRKALRRFADLNDSTPSRLRTIKDPEEIRQMIHGLKGVAGNLGATELARCCLDVEQEFTKSTPSRSTLDHLAECLETLCSAIFRAIPQNLPPVVEPTQQDTGQCGRLAELPSLMESDIALALETWEEIRSDVKLHFPGQAKSLDTALQQFKTRQARTLITEILSTLPNKHLPQEQEQ